MSEQKPPHMHRWAWCDHCEGHMVICGKCGNNCCNGGYGTLPDGSTCDACPSAYAKQDVEGALARNSLPACAVQKRYSAGDEEPK